MLTEGGIVLNVKIRKIGSILIALVLLISVGQYLVYGAGETFLANCSVELIKEGNFVEGDTGVEVKVKLDDLCICGKYFF